MSLPAEFREVLDAPPASVVVALLPREAGLGVSDVRSRIEAAGLEIAAFETLAPSTAAVRWEARVDVLFPTAPGEGDVGTFRLRLEAYNGDLARVIEIARENAREILPDDALDAAEARFALAVESRIDGDPIFAYQAQLKLLAALAHEARVVLDVGSFTVHSRAWLDEHTRSSVPPGPTELFSIHAVTNEKNDRAWLHTHGLDRCGILELEAFDVPVDFAGRAANMINAAAALWIENGIPDSKTPFEVGQGISLAWLPWTTAMTKASRDAGGRKEDRDETHRGARGVLFVPRKGFFGTKLENLSYYRPLFEGHPVFYKTTFETVRKARLARERVDRLAAIFARHGMQEDWAFLVKLGYEVDGTSDGSREHLWFTVNSLNDDSVDATLVNEPHAIRALTKGSRGTHPLDRLSDWTVMCPLGRFDAETIVHLERRLG